MHRSRHNRWDSESVNLVILQKWQRTNEYSVKIFPVFRTIENVIVHNFQRKKLTDLLLI